MVFKKYRYHKGKKLGPYYYESVRQPDGSIKTIYLGTEPPQNRAVGPGIGSKLSKIPRTIASSLPAAVGKATSLFSRIPLKVFVFIFLAVITFAGIFAFHPVIQGALTMSAVPQPEAQPEIPISSVPEAGGIIDTSSVPEAAVPITEETAPPPAPKKQLEASSSASQASETPSAVSDLLSGQPKVTGFGGMPLGEGDPCLDLAGLNEQSITETETLCYDVYYMNDTNNNGAIIISGQNLFLDCNNATIIGNGAGGSTMAINITAGSNVTVKNCNISNYSDNIKIYNSNFTTIANTTISHMQFTGITLLNTNNTTLTNLTISTGKTVSSKGIFVWRGSHENITNNRITNMNSSAIQLWPANNSLISGNYLATFSFSSTSYGDAINVSGNKNIITNNTIINATRNAIDIWAFDMEDSNSTVSYNFIDNCSNTSIRIRGNMTVVFANTINDSNKDAIDLERVVNITVYNNTITNIRSSSAIQLMVVNNSTIYNNTLLNSSKGVFITGASENNTIHTNNITNISGSCLAISTLASALPANNTIFNNYFNGSSGVFVTDSGADNKWNTTNTTAENIIGGSHIAGNAYSNYGGMDSDGDGIGSLSYEISGTAGSIDYVPLSNAVCLGLGNLAGSVYLMNESVTLCSGTHNFPAISFGSAIIINTNNTTLNCNGSIINGSKTTSGGVAINITKRINVNITNCFLQNYYYGINISDSNNTTITNSHIRNNTVAGIIIDKSSNNTTIQNVTFSGGEDGGQLYGILSEKLASFIHIYNTTVTNMSLLGIELNSTSVLFHDNSIFLNGLGAASDGLTLNGTNYTIYNNLIYNNSRNGIFIDGGPFQTENITITNNTIYNNSAAGINLSRVQNTTIYQNNILYNVLTGIYIENSLNNTIHNTSIYKNAYGGIHLKNTNWTVLSNVSIYNNTAGATSALLFKIRTANNTLFNSNLTDNTEGNTIEFGEGSSDNLVYNNYLPGGVDNGIRNRWNTTLTPATENIIGGPSIAGNFYTAYLSAVDSNGDGFADDPYSIPSGNASSVDYLPLTDKTCLNITEYQSSGYYMNSSVTLCRGTYPYTSASLSSAIIINADNISLNCNESLLNGSKETSSAAGINITGRINVNLTNCNISNFRQGINITNSNNTTISNTLISNNTQYGLFIQTGSNNTTITNSTFTSSGLGCINPLLGERFTENVQVYNSTFVNASSSVVELNSSGVVFKDNIVYGGGKGGATVPGDGVALIISTNHTVSNNFIHNNTNSGIFLSGSSSGAAIGNSTFSNNTIKNNTWAGINLTDTSNVSILGSVITANSKGGIYLLNANNTTIFNSTISFSNLLLNDVYGIRLKSTNFTRISNMSVFISAISSNGVDFLSNSGNNTIYNSNITGSYDISFGTPSSSDNLVYNNYLNLSYDDGMRNSWNTTQTVAKNIIEGPTIAGNYWTSYPGGDWTLDGFGDNPYAIAFGSAGSYDYMPLTDKPCYNFSLLVGSYVNLTTNTSICRGNYTTSTDTGGGIFRIIGNNVTLDCNKSTFNGTGTTAGVAINVTGKSGINISNCNLQHFMNGIYAKGMNHSYIQKNTFYNYSTAIISYGNCTNNTILNNTITLGSFYGIQTTSMGDHDLTIHTNIIANNTFDGIWFATNNTTVYNNVVFNNSVNGIHILGGNSTVYNNTVYNNTENGIYVEGSFDASISNVSIYNNLIYNNTKAGLNISGAINLTAYGNVIQDNRARGIYISYSNNTTLYNMTISGTGWFDAGWQSILAVNTNFTTFYNITAAINSSFMDKNVYFVKSSNNTIYTSNFSNSGGPTLTIWLDSNSGDNLIYNNYLQDLYDYGSRNKWNTTFSTAENIIRMNVTGGNYHTAYPGGDWDANGIGDIPFQIPQGTAGSYDYAPLTDKTCVDLNFTSSYLNVTGNTSICRGTYDLTDFLSSGRLRILGNNITLDCNLSTINGTGSGYGINITNGVIGTNISRCTLRNYGMGIISADMNLSVIHNNVIYNYSNAGIFIGANSTNDSIFNNTIYSGAPSGSSIGIYVGSGSLEHTNGLILHSNVIYNNSVSGIVISTSSTNNTTIYNNILYNNSATGLTSYGSSNTTIYNNSMFNNSKEGILISGVFESSVNITLYNNLIYNNSLAGLNITGVQNLTAYSNNISYNTKQGLNMNNVRNSTIYASTINLNSYGGVYLANVNNTTLYNLTVQNNTGMDGFDFATNACNNTLYTSNISGNTGSSYDLWLFSGSIDNLVYNNYFTTSGVDMGTRNKWNITLTAAENIIRRTGIAGNFYQDYAGFDLNNDSVGEINQLTNGGGSGIDYAPITDVNCVNLTKIGGNKFEINFTDMNVTLCGVARYSWPDNTSSGAIVINVNNTTLNCNGSTLQGTNSGSGVRVFGKNNFNITNCTFTNYTEGVHVQDASFAGTFTNNTFVNNTVGLYIRHNASRMNVSNSSFSNNSYAGLQSADAASHSLFENLHFSWNGYGVLVSSTGYASYGVNNTFKNITAFKNSVSGIAAENASNDTFESIISYNNTEYGISLNQTVNATLRNIDTYNNTLSGIYSSTYYNSTLNNVTSTYNAAYGIYLASGSETTVSNSFIKYNTLDGFVATSGANNNTVHTTNISYNTKTGAAISGNRNYLYNNDISRNLNTAIIVGNSSNSTLYNNTIFNNTNDGIMLENANNTTAYNNTIINSSRYGFQIKSGSANNTLHTSNISLSTTYGIYMSSGSRNLIYNNYLNNTFNALDSGSANSWNTSLTTAVNIIGGSRIGGNYYLGYAGGDLDSNGVGENVYLLPEGSAHAVDYLPLTGSGCYNLSRDNRSTQLLTGNTLLCRGGYVADDSDGNGVLVVNTSNVYLNCTQSLFTGNQVGYALNVTDVQNVNVTDCYVKNYSVGMYLLRLTRGTVFGNNITNITASGIFVVSGSNTTIYNNTLSLSSESGIKSSNGSAIAIYNNSITASTKSAVLFENTNSSAIFNNSVQNNSQAGVNLTLASSHSTVYNNNVTANGGYGAYLASGTVNNTLYNNYFSNAYNGFDSGTGNKWNTTKTSAKSIIEGVKSAGNYFSDYTGVDCSGEDLGDTPYYMSGTAVAADYLPLTLLNGLNLTAEAFTENYQINATQTMCPATYSLTDPNTRGAFEANANNIVLYCRNAVMQGNTSGYGFSAAGRSNVTAINCTFENYTRGLSVNSTVNSTFGNFTLQNNTYGVYVGHSNNTLLGNSTVTRSAMHGVFINYSNFSNVTKSNIYNNTQYGMLVQRSWNSTIAGNNLSSNNWSLYLDWSNNNTILNNTINASTVFGINIWGNNNVIYNNYLANTVGGPVNVTNARDNGTNSWNTTKQTARNLINGSSIGGNYYDDYTTLDNDGDGIGDTGYLGITGGLNIDYLPLTNSRPAVVTGGDTTTTGILGGVTRGQVLSISELLALKQAQLAAERAAGGSAAAEQSVEVSVWMSVGGAIELSIPALVTEEEAITETMEEGVGVKAGEQGEARTLVSYRMEVVEAYIDEVTLGIQEIKAALTEEQTKENEEVTESVAEAKQEVSTGSGGDSSDSSTTPAKRTKATKTIKTTSKTVTQNSMSGLLSLIPAIAGLEQPSMITGFVTAGAGEDIDYWETVIGKGDTQNIDLNKDGSADVAVTYDTMKKDMVKLTFKQLLKPTQEPLSKDEFVKPLFNAYSDNEIQKMMQEGEAQLEEQKAKEAKPLLDKSKLKIVISLGVLGFITIVQIIIFMNRRKSRAAKSAGGAPSGEPGPSSAPAPAPAPPPLPPPPPP